MQVKYAALELIARLSPCLETVVVCQNRFLASAHKISCSRAVKIS